VNAQRDTRTAHGATWHVLLLEADEAYRIAISACILLVDGRTDAVERPASAYSALERQEFELVVWGVSQEDARCRVQVMAQLRSRTDAPIIVVDGGVEAAELHLQAGADHWLPKPFAPGALVGALRAALRSSASRSMPAVLRTEIRGMVLDGGKRKLTFAGAEVLFTRQEWDLLSILLSHPDRFLAAQEILQLGWSAGEHAAEQLRTYVHRLRQKLEPLDLPCRLLSQHGQGYCLLFADHADHAE
jgi:DNA-binding response OmpR family regulator